VAVDLQPRSGSMVSCGFDGMVRSLSLQWSAGLPGLLEDADVYIDMTCIIYIYTYNHIV
jgi:hypothetical protein